MITSSRTHRAAAARSLAPARARPGGRWRLARRRRDPRDRRKVEIEVTAAAADLGWTFFGPLLAGMVGAMRSFSAAELDTAEEFLREVGAVVRWRASG
jgi:hypothetical protein